MAAALGVEGKGHRRRILLKGRGTGGGFYWREGAQAEDTPCILYMHANGRTTHAYIYVEGEGGGRGGQMFSRRGGNLQNLFYPFFDIFKKNGVLTFLNLQNILRGGGVLAALEIDEDRSGVILHKDVSVRLYQLSLVHTHHV